ACLHHGMEEPPAQPLKGRFQMVLLVWRERQGCNLPQPAPEVSQGPATGGWASKGLRGPAAGEAFDRRPLPEGTPADPGAPLLFLMDRGKACEQGAAKAGSRTAPGASPRAQSQPHAPRPLTRSPAGWAHLPARVSGRWS